MAKNEVTNLSTMRKKKNVKDNSPTVNQVLEALITNISEGDPQDLLVKTAKHTKEAASDAAQFIVDKRQPILGGLLGGLVTGLVLYGLQQALGDKE